MDDKQIERNIREINGSLAIEGMPLTKKEKEDMRAVLRGEKTFQEIKRKILEDFQLLRPVHE